MQRDIHHDFSNQTTTIKTDRSAVNLIQTGMSQPDKGCRCSKNSPLRAFVWQCPVRRDVTTNAVLLGQIKCHSNRRGLGFIWRQQSRGDGVAVKTAVFCALWSEYNTARSDPCTTDGRNAPLSLCNKLLNKTRWRASTRAFVSVCVCVCV